VSLILVLNVASIVVWESLPRTQVGETKTCFPGDVNGSGAEGDLVDAIYLLKYLFVNGPDLVGCAGDGGGDGQLTDDEVALVQELAKYVSVIDVEDPIEEDANNGAVTYKTVCFTECNVQIVNGLGATNGNEDDPRAEDSEDTKVNGLGNLIVGYNLPDERVDSENILGEDEDVFVKNLRTGSHNIIAGTHQDYSSFGGFVAGRENRILLAWGSVSGGCRNEASGPCSSVSGGVENTASGTNSSVSGGRGNVASGRASSVSGGSVCEASGEAASVSGGLDNVASGFHSSVSGGSTNEASGRDSSVSGGGLNEASEEEASVSGGRRNIASGFGSTVSGGGGPGTAFGNEASGAYSVVSGGEANMAEGSTSTIGGGIDLTASDDEEYLDPDTE